jgi:hypothetical protein
MVPQESQRAPTSPSEYHLSVEVPGCQGVRVPGCQGAKVHCPQLIIPAPPSRIGAAGATWSNLLSV